MAQRIGGGTQVEAGGKPSPNFGGSGTNRPADHGAGPVDYWTATASSMGPPVPVVWGRHRVLGRPLITGGTATLDAEYMALNPKTGVYQPTTGPAVAVAFGLAEAPLSALTRVWWNRSSSPQTLAASVNYFTGNGKPIELQGARNAAPWAFLNWEGWDLAPGLAWEGTAYARCEAVVMTDGKLPEASFEVVGRCGQDAHPADVIVDLLTVLGPLRPDQVEVDLGPDGSVASGFRRYCDAMHAWIRAQHPEDDDATFRFNRALVDRRSIGELLREALICTNSTAIWSEGKLKILPLGDAAIGTYQPPQVAVVIDDDEILREGWIVEGTRVPEANTRNCFPVTIRSQEKGYDVAHYEWIDDDDAQSFANGKEKGVRRAAVTDLPWVTSPVMAMVLSQLMAKHSRLVRNRFRITVNGSRWSLLEPGDMIALTHAPLGVENLVCRIESLEEDGSGRTIIVAREAPESAAVPVDVTPQRHDGYDGAPYWPGSPGEGPEGPQGDPGEPGADAVLAFLTKAAHVFPASSDGTITSYSGASTEMKVFVGLTDDSANWTVTRSNGSGVTSTIANRVVTITGMSGDVGYVDVTATKGEVSITRRFSLSKSKQGAKGDKGDKGDPGEDGADGAPGEPGSAGQRGSLQLAVAIAGTSWNSTTATNAILAAGGGVRVIGDRVTLFNSSAQWAETRAWDGSAWVQLVLALDGNLLVDGTVITQKLAARAVTIDKLQVGSLTDNLWPNGNSELPMPAGADTTGPEWGWRNSGGGYGGTTWRRYRSNTSGAEEVLALDVPCSPGDQFVITAMCGSSVAGGAGVFMGFRNAAGSWVGWGTGSSYAAPGGGWNPVRHDGVAPDGAVTCRAYLWVSPSRQGWWDNIYVRRKVTGSDLAVDSLRTSNYAEDGNGNVLSGAKLDHVGEAFKVAKNNLWIGNGLWSERARFVGAVTIGQYEAIKSFELNDWVDVGEPGLFAVPVDYTGSPNSGAFVMKRLRCKIAALVGGRNKWTWGEIEVSQAPGQNCSVTYNVFLVRP